MHVDVYGHGPDLVLIHGWAMHGGIFAPLAPLLGAHFRVHAVDLPGHGRSIEAPQSIDPARCAAWLCARLPHAIWAGWSYGGLVGLSAALQFPRQVRGLVQIATTPRFVSAPDWPHGVAADVFTGFGRGLLEDHHGTIERFLALETLGSPRARDELRELKAHVFERGDPLLQVLEQALSVMQVTDLRDALPRLSPPSLWIAGRRDRLVPSAAMRWSAEHCPHGHFVELASGHAPFLRHAGEVADAIVDFAATLPP